MMTDAHYASQVTDWLTAAYGTDVAVSLVDAEGGRVNDTKVATVHTGTAVQRLVIKRLAIDGAVFSPDPHTEPRFLQMLRTVGAPVPQVRFIDDGRHLGRPGFAMDWLPGRGVPDDMLTGYLGSGWFQDADAATQRDTWERFHDTLAGVHRLPIAEIATATSDNLDQLSFWRSALSAVAHRDAAPLQHEAMDWLSAHRLRDGQTRVGVCMGDARLANALFNTDRVWLVDWELGYLGHPAADIAYSLRMHEFFTANSDLAAPGIPTAEQTWRNWEDRSGWRCDDRDYWMVHAGMVIAITATRAMAAMMRTPENPTPVPPEEYNPFAIALHDLVARANR